MRGYAYVRVLGLSEENTFQAYLRPNAFVKRISLESDLPVFCTRQVPLCIAQVFPETLIILEDDGIE